MNRNQRLFIVFFLSATFTSCHQGCDCGGIIVGEELDRVANERAIDYCSLLNKAVHKDSIAIIKLIRLDMGDGTPGYDNAVIKVELVNKIGEQKIISTIGKFNNQDKKLFRGDLDAGLEYDDNPKFKERKLQDVFPLLYTYLTDAIVKQKV